MADPPPTMQPARITRADGTEIETSDYNTVMDELTHGGVLSPQNYAEGIPVRTHLGTVEMMSPEAAKVAVVRGLGDITTQKAYNAQQEQAIYDAPFINFASRLASGATLGLSDVAASRLLPGWSEDARRLAEANPKSTLLGEGVGGVATMLATGGGAGLGSLAARGATRLGAAEAGLLARSAAMGATGAAEGAAFSVGKELSDAALSGREMDSSKIMQAIGAGALLGGAIGGALPVAGAGLSSAFSAGKNAAFSAGSSLAQRALGEEGLLALAESKALKAAGVSEEMINRLAQESPAVKKAADSILSKDIFAAAGKAEGTILSKEEAKVALRSIQKESQGRFATALEQLDNAAMGGKGPSIGNIVQRAETEVFAPLETKVLDTAASKEARSVLTDLAALKDYRVSYTGLSQISDELGGMLAKGGGGEKAKFLQGIQRLISEEIEKGAVAASERLGVDLAGEIATQGQRVAASGLLVDAAEQAAAKAAKGGQLFGTLKEVMSGGGILSQAGSVFGGFAGSAFGPAAAAAGATAGRVAGSVMDAGLKRLASTYGDDVLANAARAAAEGSPARLSAMVDGVTAQGVSSYLKKAASAAASGASRAASVARAETVVGAEKAIRKALFGEDSLSAAPTKKVVPMEERVKNASKGKERGGADAAQVKRLATNLATSLEQQQASLERALLDAPPDVAAVLRGQFNASTATTKYLLSLIPVSSNQTSSLTPQVEAPRMSKVEVDRFVTAARVVADPLSVIDSMAKGNLSRTEVEALQATAPEIYQSVVQTVQAQLTTLETPLPYKDAVQLSTLLGVSGDPSLQPATMLWLQAAYGPPQEPPPQQVLRDAPSRGKINAVSDWKVDKEEP